MPSKKVIYIFAILFLVVVGWLWWLGRPTTEAVPAITIDTASSTANLPPTLVNNWPAREAVIENNLAPNYASGTKPAEFSFSLGSTTPIKRSALKIVSAATSTVVAYGPALATALAPYAAPRENELTVLGQAYDTQDATLVAKLKAARILHQTVQKNLLAVKVPADAADLHLTLVNDLTVLISLAKNMEQVSTQPLLALQSGQVYQLALVNFYSQLGTLNNYFTKWGVTLDQKDRINIFVNIK